MHYFMLPCHIKSQLHTFNIMLVAKHVQKSIASITIHCRCEIIIDWNTYTENYAPERAGSLKYAWVVCVISLNNQHKIRDFLHSFVSRAIHLKCHHYLIVSSGCFASFFLQSFHVVIALNICSLCVWEQLSPRGLWKQPALSGEMMILMMRQFVFRG